MLLDHAFACPYCGETISMTLDLSVDEQQYIEDCEVCCRPIELYVGAEDEHLIRFEARRGDD
jgi:transcription elongation factor Elf1